MDIVGLKTCLLGTSNSMVTLTFVLGVNQSGCGTNLSSNHRFYRALDDFMVHGVNNPRSYHMSNGLTLLVSRQLVLCDWHLTKLKHLTYAWPHANYMEFCNQHYMVFCVTMVTFLMTFLMNKFTMQVLLRMIWVWMNFMFNYWHKVLVFLHPNIFELTYCHGWLEFGWNIT